MNRFFLAVTLVYVAVSAHARVAPPGYALDSFEACYQRVRQLDARAARIEQSNPWLLDAAQTEE